MKLKINEKEYRLVWGLPAISRFCENVNHADDLEKAFDLAFPSEGGKYPMLKTIKARYELIYAAIEVGCELDRVENDLTMLDLQHFIDNADQEVVDRIFEDFFKSKYLGKAVEDYLFESVTQEEAPSGKPEKKSRRASS